MGYIFTLTELSDSDGQQKEMSQTSFRSPQNLKCPPSVGDELSLFHLLKEREGS